MFTILGEGAVYVPRIISVGTGIPAVAIEQDETMEFAKQLFSNSVKDLDRLLNVFHNGEIEKRHVVKELEWYRHDHTFSEKNDAFNDAAVKLCVEAIDQCLHSPSLKERIPYEEIDAIFMVTTTGLSTPSLEARDHECPAIFQAYEKNADLGSRLCRWGSGIVKSL